MTAVPIVAALGAMLVLAGCQMPQQPRQFGGISPALRATYTQASLQQANRQVDRFEAARSTQGMSGVSADIEIATGIPRDRSFNSSRCASA